MMWKQAIVKTMVHLGVLSLLLLDGSSAHAWGALSSGEPGQDTHQAPKHGAVPLLRFLLLSTQQHFYTNEEEEKYNFQGALQEEHAGYVMRTALPGLVPLYRLSKTGNGYFYTISEASKKGAIADAGFKLNGIVGYVSPVKTPDTTPLYRLYRAAKPLKKGYQADASNYPDHFYTSKAAEKQGAIDVHKYVDEGIEGYLWKGPVVYSGSGVPADGSYHPLPYMRAAIALNKAHETFFGTPNTDPARTDALIAKLRSGPSAMETQYLQGLQPNQAEDFFRSLLQNDSLERRFLVSTVFNQVYGFASIIGSTPEEKKWLTLLKAGKATYGQILLAELWKMSDAPEVRRTMIERAYIATMGRKPFDKIVIGKEISTQGEQSYWMPRKEYFSQIVSASRDWLYSPAGNADLEATIARALKLKLNRAPKEAEKQQALNQWKPKRAIFAEMIEPLGILYYTSQLNQQLQKEAESQSGGRPKPIVPK